jgi:hypothetical protein
MGYERDGMLPAVMLIVKKQIIKDRNGKKLLQVR